jgi:hypothetical protein
VSPFDENYSGQLAQHMSTKAEKAKATASRRAAAVRERNLKSSDASKRIAAQGCVWGMGLQNDPAKAAAIKKPSGW